MALMRPLFGFLAFVGCALAASVILFMVLYHHGIIVVTSLSHLQDLEEITNTVFFDVEIGGKPAGRIGMIFVRFSVVRGIYNEDECEQKWDYSVKLCPKRLRISGLFVPEKKVPELPVNHCIIKDLRFTV